MHPIVLVAGKDPPGLDDYAADDIAATPPTLGFDAGAADQKVQRAGASAIG